MQAQAEQGWLTRMAEFGYSVVDEPFAVGRPDQTTVKLRAQTGEVVVAKHAPARGEEAFENMRRVWASNFGERRRPAGLPRPISYLPQPGVLLSEYIPGQPLAQLGAVSADHAIAAMELLAALHGSEAQPERRRTSRGIVRSALRKADRAAELSPQHGESLRGLAREIERARAGDSELVPSHGDFSPRNVLVASDRRVIIDWDRLQWADPARDVTYFGISDWLPRLRRGRLPSRGLLKVSIDAYLSFRPEAILKKQLGFHIAAGLLRTACSLIELWPAEAYLVPALVNVARRELETA